MQLTATARWALWLLSLALLCALALWRADSGPLLQTDIPALLPQTNTNPFLEAAAQRSRDAFSQQLLVLVSGADNATTRSAAQAARKAFLDNGLHSSADSSHVEQAISLYEKHSFALLSPAQIERFENQGPAALAQDVAIALFGPAGMAGLNNDPGGYAGQFISRLPRPYPDFTPDGAMQSTRRGDMRVFLIRMSLAATAFGADSAERATRAVAAARQAVTTACADCQLQATGAALFTAAASQEARQESIWLGVTSTLLIMILIACAFRSLAPHLLGFLQLGASVTAASAAVIAVFGSIHILTLVFGTTLLGIAIDYAFLYFCEYWFGRSPPTRVMAKIRSGLGVGLLTGVLAFAFLALTGFPALSQMAVFSIAGLIEAALVVALIFPVTLTAAPHVAAHRLVAWPQRFVAWASRPSRWRYLLPVLALIVAAPGWWQLDVSDDVRALSHFPPALMQTDQSIRATLGRYPASGYFLTQAADMDQALAQETRLFTQLDTEMPHANALGLAGYLPPPQRQRASLAAWQDILTPAQALQQAFAGKGLPTALATRIEHLWQQAQPAPLTATTLLNTVPALQRFVIHSDHGVALMATVFGDRDLDDHTLAAIADTLPASDYIQPLQRFDRTFASIRVRATWLVVIGYLLISFVLIWRYGPREAARMLYPPLLALALTLGTLGWLGVPLNVFSVVALILILGLGRDYAVFLREVGARERATALAVTLSAITTIIGFGLLAFSKTPALHAFGLATGIGILISYCVTPLSLPPAPDDQ